MTEITEIAVCFLIGLAAAVISALVFRWAMHDFCYSSFSEAAVLLARGGMFAGAFVIAYTLPLLIGRFIQTIF